MTTVGSYAAKTHLPELLKRASRGEKILITLRGFPIAMLSPPHEYVRENLKEVVEEMLHYRTSRKRTLGKLTIRQMIEEGRRF